MKKLKGVSPKKFSAPVFKGAIFDVDGVIIDTAHIHYLSWNKVFIKYGIEFTQADFKKKIDGKPRINGAVTIMPDATAKQIQAVCDEKQKVFQTLLAKEKVKVFLSTVKFIKELKKNNIKLALASSSRNSIPILKRLGLYDIFDAEVEGANLKIGKPHPEIFLLAVKKLKLKPENCIVFEDAQLGIDAAKNAKIKCVAVNRDLTHILRGADITIHNFKEFTFKKAKAMFEV
ncbi:MAG: beta-phosphoglucomutase family hydrolase [bacterium]